jgi:desulfoferrodoxin (superoxide reductase-like protein)
VPACGSTGGDPQRAVVVPEWQEVADGLEASNQCCFSRAEPPTDPAGGAPDNHAPELAVTDEGQAIVSLAAGHPMTESHWITTLYVRDQSGIVIGYRDFGQIGLKPQFSRNYVPELRFDLPAGTTNVRAFSFCNLHSHWVGIATNV